MWKYIRPYLHFAIIAGLFMVGEITLDLVQPTLMATIVDDGVLAGNLDLILKYGGIMIILVVIGGTCGSMNNVFVQLSGQNIGNEMRKDCFKKIMSFSFPQIDHFSTGALVTRVTIDITQVQNFISQFVRGVIRQGFSIFGSIYFIYRLNHTFGKIMMFTSPLMLLVMGICLYKSAPILTTLQKYLDHINEILQEDMDGIRIIKACVKETYEKIRFHKANDDLVKTQLTILMIFAFMNPVINLIMYTIIVLLLFSAGMQVAGNTITAGAIIATITYTTQLLHGVLMLVMLFQNITKGLTSWKRIKQVLVLDPMITGGKIDTVEGEGRIEFKNVSFGYDHKEILHDLNFTIEPGESIAIMSETGGGKSTLVNLIARFYDVTKGNIYLDGVDLKDYTLKALHEKVTIAMQKSELFNITLKDNIAWGLVVSDQEIEQAAKIAQAHDFISETEYGYDTLVQEQGSSLSGGQKQRISLARAILHAKEVLILDDATSALDLATEAKFYQALSNQKITKIIVAQRIASVQRCDRILVLNGGTIEDIGTHQELMDRCTTYQQIYESQLGGVENGF